MQTYENQQEPQEDRQQNIKQMLDFYSHQMFKQQNQSIPFKNYHQEESYLPSNNMRSFSSMEDYNIKTHSKLKGNQPNRGTRNNFSKMDVKNRYDGNKNAFKQFNTYLKSSESFAEVSDWSNNHKYINQSIILPKIRISEMPETLTDEYSDKMMSEIINSFKNSEQCKNQSQYKSKNDTYFGKFIVSLTKESQKKRQIPTKSVDIKFGLPQGMKSYQKSFYENSIRHSIKEARRQNQEQTNSLEKKTLQKKALNPNEYVSLQEHMRQSYYMRKQEPQNKMLTNAEKAEQEENRLSLINRVMNRKTRKNRTHFLQQYLTSCKMSVQNELKQKLETQISNKEEHSPYPPRIHKKKSSRNLPSYK